MSKAIGTFFAPQLIISHGVTNIDFYTRAFGADVLRTFENDDGTIHVAELSIHGALFHLHEEGRGSLNPENCKGTTTIIGLFVPDVDDVMKMAMKAGAKEIEPAQDYDYGYRQGKIEDPFGHIWMIEKKI